MFIGRQKELAILNKQQIGIAPGNGVGKGKQQPVFTNPKHFSDLFRVVQLKHFIQNGKAVPNRTIGKRCDQRNNFFRHRPAFGFDHFFQLFPDRCRIQPVHIKPLAAGENRCGDFMDFGRRQNKNRMGRRFFQRFQQSVERLDRQFMDFVNDIYFIGGLRRRIHNFIADPADIVNPVVARRINLGNIINIAV